MNKTWTGSRSISCVTKFYYLFTSREYFECHIVLVNCNSFIKVISDHTKYYSNQVHEILSYRHYGVEGVASLSPFRSTFYTENSSLDISRFYTGFFFSLLLEYLSPLFSMCLDLQFLFLFCDVPYQFIYLFKTQGLYILYTFLLISIPVPLSVPSFRTL